MRKVIIFLCSVSVLLSGCGNRNNKNTGKSDNQLFNENDSGKIYFLDFEQNLKNFKKDTFTINSIAKDIKFIPLETSDMVLLYSDNVKIKKINDRYLISSSSIFTAFHYIMMFDSTGRFIDYLMRDGQGPKELPYFHEWSYNHNTQLLVVSSWHQIILHSFENNTTNKYTLDGFFTDGCLLNDGTIVGLPNTIGKGDTDTPYPHFLNQEGKIVHSIYYPHKRNIDYIIPQGQNVGHIEEYALYPGYSGDALFKDMFNDTIYRIWSMDDVKPYIILHKGSLAPTIKDINNQRTGAQKVRLFQIFDTKKYFFIKFGYRGETYNSIWDKQTGALIANTKHPPKKLSRIDFNSITNYRTPTGKVILIQIASYVDGKLYCVLDAEQAMEFLPGIVYDDNPVLMIIDI